VPRNSGEFVGTAGTLRQPWLVFDKSNRIQNADCRVQNAERRLSARLFTLHFARPTVSYGFPPFPRRFTNRFSPFLRFFTAEMFLKKVIDPS
jgi:hypothetical protein